MKWELYPLIRLIIPFTLGMIGANLFVSHMDLVVLFILCCAVLAFSFFFIKTSDIYRDSKFGVIAMCLFFLIGMTLHTEKYRHIEQGTPQDTTFCQGVLTEAPIEKARSWALTLEQGNGVHLLLYIGKDKVAPQHDSITFSTIQIGDTIFAKIRHLSATNTCENDTFKTYNTYLFHHGICATAYTPPNQWFVHSCQSSPSLFSTVESLQGKLHAIYDEHGINGEAGNIIEAMTIGQKAHLSKDIRTAYAHAGVSHVLALSGFHVGIIILIIQIFFLKPLLPLRWQWVSNLFIIAVLWLYAFIAGASPSLIRASLMFTILLLCQSVSREAISLNAHCHHMYLRPLYRATRRLPLWQFLHSLHHQQSRPHPLCLSPHVECYPLVDIPLVRPHQQFPHQPAQLDSHHHEQYHRSNSLVSLRNN